jgi:DNA polymerase-3 subunit delta'
MPLAPLAGHHEARRRLGAAFLAGRLPQVMVLTGPAGVGKQRLALWLAQLLLCERPEAEPCGKCVGCRQMMELRHPDLHWLIPIPRPKAGDPEKQVEEAAEAIGELLEERRVQPLWARPDGMASHSVASVRVLQRAATLTSVSGGRRAFIIGDAERLVPQESSQEAANALLKLLEEPPSGSTFILTTVDARHLLPTMRSRAAPLRLQRLADADVQEFLERYAGVPAREVPQRVRLAAGVIGAAIVDDDAAGSARRAAEGFLEAALQGRGPRMQAALGQAPFAARGEFTALLDAVAETLTDAARGALGAASRHPVPAALRGRDPEALVRSVARVEAAREAAHGNVNPQLLLAVLGDELAETL